MPDDDHTPLAGQLVVANSEADDLASLGSAGRRLLRDMPYRIPVDAFKLAH